MDSTVNNSYSNEKAIIIGGGFSGLLTARVLADHFKRVIVIERDAITDSNQFISRKGAPQGEHIHTLMTKGAAILLELFPTLEEALLKNGSIKVDATEEILYCVTQRNPTFESKKYYTYLQSRPLLEGTIRSLLKEHENVSFVYGTEVNGLLTSFKDKKITGVNTLNIKTNEVSNLYSDLIVDASGRFTKCPEWIENLGYTPINKNEIGIDIHYLSRIFHWPASYTPKHKIIFIKAVPQAKRSGTLSTIENDAEGKRCIVTIVGQHGDYPTEENFMDFVKSLPFPDLYDAIKEATPLTPCVPLHFPHTRRYYYENASIPAGFIAIGDSIAALSPSGGIGMTSCALAVETLNQILKESSISISDLGRKYFKNISKRIDVTWETNSNLEFLFPNVTGKKPFALTIKNWLTLTYFSLCYEKYIWEKCFLALNCEIPRWKLMLNPYIAFRVIGQTVKKKLGLSKQKNKN